jgi:hypothetical protein
VFNNQDACAEGSSASVNRPLLVLLNSLSNSQLKDFAEKSDRKCQCCCLLFVYISNPSFSSFHLFYICFGQAAHKNV